MMLPYAAHDSLLHLFPLVPYFLGDADGDCNNHASYQKKESGVNIGKTRAVEGHQRCAPWHLW